MNNIFKLCIIIAVSLFSLFGYFYYKNTINHSEEYIYIDTATTEVIEYIEKINKMEEQVFKFVDDDDMELAYLENTQDIELKYIDKKGVLEFFLAAISLNDIDLFIQSFELYTISKDIHSSAEKNKDIIIKDLISRLSREGKLIKVGFNEEKGRFGATSETVNATFFYSDGFEATVPITFSKTEDHHNGEEVYSISTSVFDMLNIIEKDKK